MYTILVVCGAAIMAMIATPIVFNQRQFKKLAQFGVPTHPDR